MAKFKFTQFDAYECDSVTCTTEITDKNIILSLTEAQLKSLAKDNIVGKTNTVCGEKSYYADAIQLGGFRLSIQANYPVWKERHKKGTPHETPITEEEFNNVKFFMVEVKHDKTWIIQPDEMTIQQIVNLLKGGLK